MRLETERLLIRLPARGDEHALSSFYVQNREFLQPWSPTFDRGFFEPAAWRERIEGILAEYRNGRGARLIFFSKVGGGLVGMASLTNITGFPTRSAQLGYSVAEDAGGKGLMTEALHAVLDFGFNFLGLHRIEANFIPRNKRSGRVLEKLGFRIEGESKEYVEIDGRWEDHYRTAILEWEWKAKRPSQDG